MGINGDPGPSTLASSSSSSSAPPAVPPGVRHMRVKKRVINLVNPADPSDFSPSTSPMASPNTSSDLLDGDSPVGRRRSRETTPVWNGEQAINVPTFNIRGVDDNGVKGILRQTGTPGSGNGVRFFPKNRFRVITPNASALSTPQPIRPPSLFSQLLSVVPPLSPLRVTSPGATADESWEQPGQEGEVSMAASSIASAAGDVSLSLALPVDEDEGMIKEDSWSGVPTQISSPLALPIETSREVSFAELPSADILVPDDMSNLLSTRFSPPPGDSFSILQLPAVPLRSLESSSSSTQTPTWGQESVSSSVNGSVIIHDDQPTIRRRPSPSASPRPAQLPETPHSPTPSNEGKPWRSIFADMSAEQAELSWPLSRPITGGVSADAESPFHSIALTDTLDLPDLPRARTSPTTPAASTSTPRAAGNVTEYFDASSFAWATPCPKPLVSTISSTTIAVAPGGSIRAASDLVEPAKALFEAQAEHTSAIVAELALYRSLAATLQAEVTERDAVLAELNLRAVEAEMLRSQNADLQAEVSCLRAASPSNSESPSMRAMSRRAHPGDRTTVEQAESREMEIRLAKALADQEVMAKQLNEMRGAGDDVVKQLSESRKSLRLMEDRERDRAIWEQKEAELQSETEELREQLDSAQSLANRDTIMIQEMRAEIESQSGRERQLEEELQSTQVALSDERMKRQAADRTTADLTALQKELAKLRLESSSKDLEISALQRRKTELKEDREMLNIALDSKQQELELVKRKYGVRGIAGSTALGTSRKINLETPAPAAYSSLGKAPESTAPRTTRKASASGLGAQWETPLISDKRANRHGVPLHASTIKGKGMRGIEEELRAQDAKGGSLRRGRMVA